MKKMEETKKENYKEIKSKVTHLHFEFKSEFRLKYARIHFLLPLEDYQTQQKALSKCHVVALKVKLLFFHQVLSVCILNQISGILLLIWKGGRVKHEYKGIKSNHS
jgi:hypothetical protein